MSLTGNLLKDYDIKTIGEYFCSKYNLQIDDAFNNGEFSFDKSKNEWTNKKGNKINNFKAYWKNEHQGDSVLNVYVKKNGLACCLNLQITPILKETYGPEKFRNMKNRYFEYFVVGEKLEDLRGDEILKDYLYLLSGKKHSLNTIQNSPKKESEKIIVRKEEPAAPMKDFDKNIILYGPPGTGKTYNSVLWSVAIASGKTVEEVTAQDFDSAKEAFDRLKGRGRISMVTFHQSYGYEEFIEGIRPAVDDDGFIMYKVIPGVFRSFCEKAASDAGNRYVFIIDEINRGNISKIFGELITLAESDKRAGAPGGLTAVLPYSKTEFGIPGNVYILGTMNTADRSIAIMDTALRRRFSFVEMMPDPHLLSREKIVLAGEAHLIDLESMLTVINERIEFLYDREHTIGHAYFMALKENPTLSKLGEIFKNMIIPLLMEYFFDDYEKVRLVLGDTGKADRRIQFITKEEKTPSELFSGGYDLEPAFVYRVNNEAFGKVKSYTDIYTGLGER